MSVGNTKRRLKIFSAILLCSACACAPAISRPRGGIASGGSPPPATCSKPIPDGQDDGCASATHVGLYVDANWFTNTVNWNDQSVTPPTWNVAYVDYGVGQYTATGSMVNPSLGGLAGQGCSYSSSDHVLNCTGSGTLTVNGYYFNDMILYVHGSYSAVNIINNKFLYGTFANSAFNSVRVDDQGTNTTLVDDWNTYDQAGNTGLISGTQTWQDNRTTAHAIATEHHYNALLNTTSKIWVQNGCQDPNVKYNASIGWPAPSGDGQHAEVELFCGETNGVNPLATVWFNTDWQPRDQDNTSTPAGGTTAFHFLTLGFSVGQTYQNIDVRYNVENINKNNNLGTPAVGIVSGEVMGIQQGTYVNCLWKKNYMFAPGAFFLVADSSSGGCATTWTSNVNMRTGAAISAYNTVP